MPRPLRADRSVIRDLHVRVIGLVADAEQGYGDLGLRLEGGTALAAYHLRHRESEDLDFFGAPAMDARDFARFLRERAGGSGIAIVKEGPASRGFAELLVSEATGAPRLPLRIQLGVRSPYSLAPPIPPRRVCPRPRDRERRRRIRHLVADLQAIDPGLPLPRIGAATRSRQWSARRGDRSHRETSS